MLIPRNNTAYNVYANTRSNQAILQSELLPINPITSDGNQYGLHPSMPGIQNLFAQNKLSFINNIGTLIQPTTKQQFYNESVDLPLGLFSHSDQIRHWQTAHPHERQTIGWGGRIADMLTDMNTNETISMNVSMSGTNVFQYGNNTVEFSADYRTGAEGINGYGAEYDWGIHPARTEAIDRMLDRNYNDVYKNTYVKILGTARDASVEFRAAIDTIPDFQTQFSDSQLSQSFRMIAKAIAARDALGFKRQIFFVDYGDWDHHDELLQTHASRLQEVDNGLSEFASVLDELNMFDCITTFSISEFGRTLTSNGNGTDHAWGGNVMAMGGAVNGGDMFGQYPSLELDSPLEVGNGILIPTLSTDEYFAELALWFGVPSSELAMMFPNLGNFYSPGSGLPIGFLNI